MRTEEIRREFEQWAVSIDGPFIQSELSTDSEGLYHNDFVAYAWHGYLAARKKAMQEIN